MSNPVTGAIPAAAVPPSSPFQAWLGGLTIGLNVLALMGLWLSVGSGDGPTTTGPLLLIPSGSAGTLSLLAWLVVGC